MRLPDDEFRICQILLTAARRGECWENMREQMRREGFSEQTWRPLYEQLGLKVFIKGHGSKNEELFVYPPDNILPFAPRTVAKHEWPEVTKRMA